MHTQRLQQIQGVAFVMMAFAAVAGTLMMPRVDSRIELILVGVLILLLGVPHGALDTLYAQKQYHVVGFRGWFLFALIYVALVVSVVCLWAVAPTVFLIGFLLISAAHFSGDPADGTTFLSRLLYGGAILILPALRHAEEMQRLFSLLAGPVGAAWVTSALIGLSLPCFIALAFAALYEMRWNRLTALEFIAVGVIALVAPPLISFAVFFCGMHSARHILRTLAYAKETPTGLLLLMALLPMAGVLTAIIAIWFLRDARPLDARLVPVIFVGLAGLTVPHMVLVERLRLFRVDA